jgi:hypothetical protein
MTNKYQPVGVVGQELAKPLNRCFWQCLGAYAHGKTRLVQTNPKALILNLDESPTTHPDPQAEIWPAVDDMGQTIDTDGSPLVLTWPRVMEVIEHVLTATRAGLPGTPECVVFDSLPSAVRLCLYHTGFKLAEKADAIQRQGRGECSFTLADITPYDLKGMHGMILYGLTYDIIADTIDKLRHHNKGVGIVTHLDWKQFEAGRTKDGEAIMEDRPSLSISDALRDRIHRNLDFSFLVKRTRRKAAEMVEGEKKIVTVGDQKKEVTTARRQVEREMEESIVVTQDVELEKFIKVRAGLPPQFPVDSWADLEAVYNS